MSDLAKFLTARLAEDETQARNDPFAPWPEGSAVSGWERVLREVDAKRKILAEAQAVRKLLDLTGGEQDRYRDWVLRQMAAVWSDHPDYDPAWK